MASSVGLFLAELKHRRVYRVALAYIGASRWVTMFGLLLATAAFAACEESVSGIELRDSVLGGVTYRVKDFVIAESFPVQLGLTVEIQNTSATSQSVTFPDGCVVLMRAYVEGTTGPVWDMGRDVGCTQALVKVDLAPGESEEFQTSLVSAYTILGDDLPDGEYRITAYLRPGQIVELDAGMADLAVLRPTY